MISCTDESADRGARRKGRVDVDNPRAVWIEANGNLSARVLDLDLPLPVERERTRATAKRDSGAMIEELGAGYWNRTQKTGRNRNRHGARRRCRLTDRDPGARAACAFSREESATEAGNTYHGGADTGEHDLPQM